MNADRPEVAMGRDGVVNSFGREEVAPAEQAESDEDTLESDESYQSFGVRVPGGGGLLGEAQAEKATGNWRNMDFRVDVVEFVWPHMKFMDPDDPIRARDKPPAFKLYAKGKVQEYRRKEQKERLGEAMEIWDQHGGKDVAQVLNKKRSTCISDIKKSYMGERQVCSVWNDFFCLTNSNAQLYTEKRRIATN